MVKVLVIDELPFGSDPFLSGTVSEAVDFQHILTEPDILDEVSVIFAPLIGQQCDGLDLASFLQSKNFTGQLNIITTNLPRPHLVEREFKKFVRDMDFQLKQV